MRRPQKMQHATHLHSCEFTSSRRLRENFQLLLLWLSLRVCYIDGAASFAGGLLPHIGVLLFASTDILDNQEAATRCLVFKSCARVFQSASVSSPRLYSPKSVYFLTKSAHFDADGGDVDVRGDVDRRKELSEAFDEPYAHLVPSLRNDVIVDMLPASTSSRSLSSPSRSRRQPPPLRQAIFAFPLVSLFYERVLPPLWAAGLRSGGVDVEYDLAASFLCGGANATSGMGGVAADVSCGTGFFARRLADSGKFRHVVALDYSKEMLTEFISDLRRTKRNSAVRPSSSSLSIVRGDAGALPFETNSLEAVHWGAAMHCVPDAERAMAEVYRVLRPGGRLYATTFLRPLPSVVFRFFDVEELDGIARGTGFVGPDNGSAGWAKAERLGPVYGVLQAVKGQQKQRTSSKDVLFG